MAGLIPTAFIDDVLARTDIVELISERIPLKKSGNNYQARCPFHSEKTPSFSVNHSKQFYHCFGCGAHGNALRFIMEYDSWGFVDAVEELAQRAGMVVPRDETTPNTTPIQADYYTLLQQVHAFYIHHLAANPSAQAYLQHRGISPATSQHFAIGYAPNDWRSLLHQFPDHHDALITLGLLRKNDQGQVYDMFRDRILFPIFDRRGRVIAFGGRVLSAEAQPKYLNSPETPLFHKGRELFNLHNVRQQKTTQIIIVEGYMDVVALAQHDIHHAVAALGTATTKEHFQVLFRTAPDLICCYDGDKAGKEAAWRALTNALPYLEDGRHLRFVFLPEGDDPDTFVQREGKAAFSALIAQAQPFLDVMLQRLLEQQSLQGDAGKFAVAKVAGQLLAALPDSFTRQQAKETLHDFLPLKNSEHVLEQYMPSLPAHSPQPPQPGLGELSPVRRAIALILQHPSAAQNIPDCPELATLPFKGMDFLLELLTKVKANPQLTTGQLIEHWIDPKIRQLLGQLASHTTLFEACTHLEQELCATFGRLLDDYFNQRLDELLHSAINGLAPHQEEELKLLLAANNS